MRKKEVLRILELFWLLKETTFSSFCSSKKNSFILFIFYFHLDSSVVFIFFLKKNEFKKTGPKLSVSLLALSDCTPQHRSKRLFNDHK